ncbi:hypothetical protein ACLB2K_072621 [Fragaria x ananassa]
MDDKTESVSFNKRRAEAKDKNERPKKNPSEERKGSTLPTQQLMSSNVIRVTDSEVNSNGKKEYKLKSCNLLSQKRGVCEESILT